MDALWNDVKVAARGLRTARLVSVVAVLSLGIGIAANTTVFTLVQALEFPHLIYPDPSRIVFLESRNTAHGVDRMPVSVPDATDIARSSQTLQSAGIAADQRSVLRAGEVPRRVSGRRVEPAFFDILRVPAALGRVLTPSDEPGVIVLSDTLWRSSFGADPAVVGRAIRLDGGTVTVAGVMPPRFDADADFWVPLRNALAGLPRDDRQVTAFARLRDGATLQAATLELATISARLALDHPATNKDWTIYPVRLSQLHGRDSRPSFLLLQAAVGFLLLIACANIANILLARGAERRYDVALRVSLGASRGRVMRGVLAEAILLALAGGVVGVVLSIWGVRMARRLGGFPDVLDPRLNLLVLAFSAAVSMLTGLLCGLAPAWRAAAISPEGILRAAGRGGGHAKGRLRAALVAAQIATALVLATSASLMLQTLINRRYVDLGFDPAGAVRADLALPWDRYRDVEMGRVTVARAIENIARQPNVTAAGGVTWALPTGAGGQRPLTLPGARDAALPASVRRGVDAATPGYFAAMGVPLRAGRAFDERDGPGAAPVAIVNEELARHLWPDRNPIGELLRLGTAGGADPVATVVGVVSTIRRSAMHDTPIARVYVPFAQYPNRTVTLVARATRDEAGARAIAAGVRDTDPALLVEQMRTVNADAAQFMAPVRLLTILLAGFGLTGVLLAGLGVFGTMSYTVSQQQRDLAVRSALGASRADLLGLVFGSALRLTATGIVVGSVAALAATRALRAYLFGVTSTDAITYVATALFLAGVSMAACYRPARVAATVDPAAVLRA